MASVVVMPKLGLTMKEGKIIKWYKAEGDPIQPGEILFEVATDKLTNEVEANEGGIVRKLLLEAGESIECLKPIAIIGSADEDISGLIPQGEGKAEVPATKGTEASEKAATPQPGQAVKVPGGRMIASPAAKKLAGEKGVDLALVTGTGPNGRITLKDVEAFEPMARVKASAMAAKTAAALGVNLQAVNAQGRVMKEDVLAFHRQQTLEVAVQPVEERVPMSQMRQVIAQRMTASWLTSPAVTYDMEVDMTRLQALKEEMKEYQKFTYTDFLVKIASVVLLQFPLLNSSIDGDELILRNYTNIGVAVAIENGLVVPVVKYSHCKSLTEISAEVKELAYKAKTNQLTSDQLSGGTFTITNLGMFGMDSFSPIINQPEVAILGVNAIREVPAVVNGQLVSKPMMKLSLTADHRVVDGAVAAQFLYTFKQYIEKPTMLLL